MSLYVRLKGDLTPYTYEIMDEIPIIRYNSAEDYDKFDQFLLESFRDIKKRKVESIIIDIRNNSGGNSALNDLLLDYITTLPYRQSSKRLWKISETSLEELESRNVVDNYGVDYIKNFNWTVIVRY